MGQDMALEVRTLGLSHHGFAAFMVYDADKSESFILLYSQPV